MKLSKINFLLTAGIAVLLIALLTLLILSGFGLIYFSGIIFSILILNSVAVVILSMVYSKKRKLRIKDLPSDYQKTFVAAQEYIGLSTVRLRAKKETSDMILEILEHAAIENRSLENVIDCSLEQYLDKFLVESGNKNSFFYSMTFSFFLFIIYLLFLKLYKVIREGSFTDDTQLDLGGIVSFAIISFVFFPLLMYLLRRSVKAQWSGPKKLIILIPFVIPFGIAAILIFVNNQELSSFLDQPVDVFNNIYSFLLGIVLAIILVFVLRFIQSFKSADR